MPRYSSDLPGYKATGYANNDIINHWRLPIESHEHRVWVAEGVKCDTLCDVSTGVDSCLEVSLVAAECVGAGATGRNASQQSMPGFQGGYGNYSRSLTATKTETAYDTSAEPTDATDDTTESLEENTFDTDEPAEEAANGDLDDTDEDLSPEDDEPPTGGLEDGSVDAPEDDLQGDNEHERSNSLTDKASEDVTMDTDEASTDPSETEADRPSGPDDEEQEDDDEDSITPDMPAVSDDSSGPSVEKRDRKDRSSSSKIAQKRGREAFESAWSEYIKNFTKVVNVIETARRPGLCPKITSSVVDTCKKGVRTQVAFCKQSLREKIDLCKRNVKDKIDQCKRSKKPWWDVRKAGCEARYRGEIPKCELARLDIPFCEFDRLTSTCCEGFRTQAKAMCSAGISTSTIQKQIQSIQTTCSIGTGLAKAATKSWLTGQMLGMVTQLQSIKEIGDTVETIRKLDQTRAKVEKWADGLAAAAEGDVTAAQAKLRSLLPQISAPVDNALQWAEAAQAAVSKNVEASVVKVLGAAGEIQAIKSAKSSIKTLKPVADDLKAIQAAAKECARVPKNITPEGYPLWDTVTSKQKIDAAVELYEQKFAKKLEAAAKCKAVVVRAQRVIGT
ncbi:hypothetical protein Q7P37_010523 [Cladosporium fusiforme]